MRSGKWLFLTLALVASQVWASDLPDRKITPGAIDSSVTQDNIQDTICVKGYPKTVRPPANYTNKLKKQQIHTTEPRTVIFRFVQVGEYIVNGKVVRAPSHSYLAAPYAIKSGPFEHHEN